MMLGPVEVLVLIGSLALTLATIVPLTGILIRFRANYNPKSLQLDPEGGATPHTGPVIQVGLLWLTWMMANWLPVVLCYDETCLAD